MWRRELETEIIDIGRTQKKLQEVATDRKALHEVTEA